MEQLEEQKKEIINIAVELYKGMLNCRISDNIIISSNEFRKMLTERTKNL